jgi:limonene-1,2-epoxide hydrolase
MGECYHPSVKFSDPVFTDLHGDEARAMWHMLCERGKDLEVSFDSVHADDTSGSARWQARYTIGKGRRVHNFVEASFTFEDDKIIEHRDDFDLWQWTRMAIGPIGTFAGWSAPVQNKVRGSAAAGLRSFIAKHPEYSQER